MKKGLENSTLLYFREETFPGNIRRYVFSYDVHALTRIGLLLYSGVCICAIDLG